MAHIVAAPCNDCKYTDCCVVCPVECFYQDEKMLEANCPPQWTSYIQLNAERCAALKDTGHITEKQSPKEGPECQKK
jgi:ferredoxin